MSRKKTHEQFVEELKVIAPFIELLSKYEGAGKPIKYRCKICKYEGTKNTANELLQGRGCPECAKKEKKKSYGTPVSDDDFRKRMKRVNPNIRLISPYSNMKTSVTFICECGNTDKLKPKKLLSGSLCKSCRNEKLRRERLKSDKTFIEEVRKVAPNIELLSKYKGAGKPIKYRCKICGYVGRKKSAHELLMGRGCSECAKRMTSSFPEQAIFYYIKKHFDTAKNKYKEGFGRSELDIFIPDIATGIEYDGRRSHKGKTESEHKKYKICKDLGIFLIRVRERKPGSLDIADRIIYSGFGDTKKYTDLDDTITELFEYLNIQEDINTERDRITIQEQYFKGIRENSIAKLFPEVAAEWYQPLNGNITPDMVAAKSNESYYWLCPKCKKPYLAIVSNKTAGYGHRCSGINGMTNEEFMNKVAEVNPNAELRGEFINSETLIEWRCKIHNTINHSRPKTLLAGGGCQECHNDNMSRERMKTQAKFIEEVAQRNPDVIILGEYKGDDEDILCKHKSCGHICNRKPRSVLNGFKCPECSKTKSKKVFCVESGKTYDSIRQASIEMGINHSLISRCCNGLAKTAGKKHFRFTDE